jgi:archaemetzincin
MQKIYVVPLDVSDSELIDKIVHELKKLLHTQVHSAQLKLNHKLSFSSDRNQYYSTQIISQAIPLTETLDGKVILVTESDLFIPIFTYVFGEAQLNGKHSIVSLCRLHEEFYTGRTDEKILFDRVMKEVLHELGHNFGLYHCSNWDCVMHSSTSVEEVDIKGGFYCTQCRNQVDQLAD